jgi:hypothetical protein
MIRLAAIFRTSFKEYLQKYGPLPPDHYRVANAIMACQTEQLGAHQYQCQSCKEMQTHFHSCRNRHCPHCQGYKSMQWVQSRTEELLAVSYFHAVFTIPSELNCFALRNKKVLYTILYRSVNETLQQLATDKKWLGAQIGFIAVLHTWGQNLQDHPHLHCIIPSGGLRLKDNQWKHCKNDFLLPIEVIKKMYRGKFMDYFMQAVNKKEIQFSGSLNCYENSATLNEFKDLLYKKAWVVYIKPSFVSPQAVINYLGNYTHRVALSEKRIHSFKDGNVSFFYKDYADQSREKLMTLPAVEFIRRFLLHVLPKGFMRIRSFGLLANKNRIERLNYCRKLLGQYAIAHRDKGESWWEQILERTGKNPLICPECENGLLSLFMILPPRRCDELLT